MSNSVEASLSRVRDTRPDVYALAVLASLSPRITPDYLRALRLKLGAKAYQWTLRAPSGGQVQKHWHPPNADSEAALWFHPLLVRGHGPEGIVFRPEISHRLQVMLRDSEFYGEAASLLKEQLEHLPRELAWQAELAMNLRSDDKDGVYGLEAQVLDALRGEDEVLARTVAHWLLQDVHPAMPDLLRFPMALVTEIAASNVAEMPLPLLARVGGRGLAELATYDLTGFVPMTDVFVRRAGGQLWISDRLEQPTYKLEIPRTNPRVVAVRSSIGTSLDHTEVKIFSPGEEPSPMEVGVGPVELRDIMGRVFRLEERPPSAILPQPDVKGDFQGAPPSAHPLIGRDRELAALRDWAGGPGAVLVLVGPPGRGKRRLSEELAAEFRGRRFVRSVREEKGGVQMLLLRLAEFLNVAGPQSLAKAVGQGGRTLIVLQGFSEADLQNANLQAFVGALQSQSTIKLLMTAVTAPTGQPVREIPPIAPRDAQSVMHDAVSAADTRAILASQSGGEPAIVHLLRSVAKELGPEAALEMARALGPSDDAATKIRSLVAALMRLSPDRYMEILGDLADDEAVDSALKEIYQPITSPDPALEPLIKWCNEYRDHRVRWAILAAMDANGRLPSTRVLQLFDRIRVWNPTDEMIKSWPFWPAVANTLAAVLARRDDETDRILLDLLDRKISRWREEQVLQIALPKTGLIADGNRHAKELVLRMWRLAAERPQAHRQGAWTLMKDIHSAGEAREAFKRFPAVDYWARMRLVVSLVQLSPDAKQELGPLGSGDPVCEFLLEPTNAYFVALLLLWAKHHRQFDLTTVFQLPEASTRVETLADRLGLPANNLFLRSPNPLVPPVADDETMAAATRDVVEQYLRGTVSEGELRVFADLISLQIEVGRDRDYRPLRRYDVFKAFTAAALMAAGSQALNVLRILARSLDEGVRWGLAQFFGPPDTKAAAPSGGKQTVPCLHQILAQEEYWAAARIMVADENEWVIRDTIQGVSELWPTLSPSDVDNRGAASLAHPAYDWMASNSHRGEEQLFDVRSRIEVLRAVCPPFSSRWDELMNTAGA